MREYANTDGSGAKGNRHSGAETGSGKRTYDLRRTDAFGGVGKSGHLRNRKHTCIDPEGVGSMLRTKINVNLGVSRTARI